MSNKIIRTNILRPKNFEGILGETFKVYGRNFLKLVTIVALVEVILGVIWIILGTIFDFASLPQIVLVRKFESLTSPMVITGIVILVVSIIAGILMVGALIHVVVEQYRRQTINIANAYASASGRLGAMAGAGFLVLLAVVAVITLGVVVIIFSWVGWVVLAVGILAAIYFVIDWAFVWQATLLEGVNSIDALARSSALVKGNWWRVLGIILLVGLITAAIGTVVTLGFTVAIRAIVAISPLATINATATLSAILERLPAVGAIIGSVLSTPIFAVAGTLLYYDLWVRKEGLWS